MPELPEVHTTATTLDQLLKNEAIEDVWSAYNSVFHAGKTNIKNTAYFAGFRKNVIGRKILGVGRRGKNVLIALSGGETVLVHMKMTGHLLVGDYERNRKSPLPGWEKETWSPKNDGPLRDPFNRYIRLAFSLASGRTLVLSDLRKFAKVCLIQTDRLNDSEDIKNLGPEPLENFSYPAFKARLFKRPGAPIKQALMDQSLIAGIGNIYSDEMLWLSGIHPRSRVAAVPEIKLKTLYRSMDTVLKKGINFAGDSTSDYRNPFGEAGGFQHTHNAYRKTGAPCPKKDGGTIERLVIGGRSAHFCPVHQTLFSRKKS